MILHRAIALESSCDLRPTFQQFQHFHIKKGRQELLKPNKMTFQIRPYLIKPLLHEGDVDGRQGVHQRVDLPRLRGRGPRLGPLLFVKLLRGRRGRVGGGGLVQQVGVLRQGVGEREL